MQFVRHHDMVSYGHSKYILDTMVWCPTVIRNALGTPWYGVLQYFSFECFVMESHVMHCEMMYIALELWCRIGDLHRHIQWCR